MTDTRRVQIIEGNGSVARSGPLTVVTAGPEEVGLAALALIDQLEASGDWSFEAVAGGLQQLVTAHGPSGVVALLDDPSEPIAFIFDQAEAVVEKLRLTGNGRAGWTTEIVPGPLVELRLGDVPYSSADSATDLRSGLVRGSGVLVPVDAAVAVDGSLDLTPPTEVPAPSFEPEAPVAHPNSADLAASSYPASSYPAPPPLEPAEALHDLGDEQLPEVEDLPIVGAARVTIPGPEEYTGDSSEFASPLASSEPEVAPLPSVQDLAPVVTSSTDAAVLPPPPPLPDAPSEAGPAIVATPAPPAPEPVVHPTTDAIQMQGGDQEAPPFSEPSILPEVSPYEDLAAFDAAPPPPPLPDFGSVPAADSPPPPPPIAAVPPAPGPSSPSPYPGQSPSPMPSPVAASFPPPPPAMQPSVAPPPPTPGSPLPPLPDLSQQPPSPQPPQPGAAQHAPHNLPPQPAAMPPAPSWAPTPTPSAPLAQPFSGTNQAAPPPTPGAPPSPVPVERELFDEQPTPLPPMPAPPGSVPPPPAADMPPPPPPPV